LAPALPVPPSPNGYLIAHRSRLNWAYLARSTLAARSFQVIYQTLNQHQRHFDFTEQFNPTLDRRANITRGPQTVNLLATLAQM
jgi:hypothetical protein